MNDICCMQSCHLDYIPYIPAYFYGYWSVVAFDMLGQAGDNNTSPSTYSKFQDRNYIVTTSIGP